MPFDLHITHEGDRRTVARLLEEGRSGAPAFALEASEGGVVTSETVARRFLDLALASERVPKFVRPKVDGTESDFVSLGVETVAVTKSKVVKFRQHVNRIPVYGSLVAIELDAEHEFVSLNSNLATPKGCGHLARISPLEASRPVAERAGYGGAMLPATPLLNYYLDRAGVWHLAYIIEHVRIRPFAPETEKYDDGHAPLAFDYVVDAMTGEIVADLPRTIALTEERNGKDVLGRMRTFRIALQDGVEVLRDPVLNVETYDIGFKDPRDGVTLPETPCPPRWSRDAVSAHANASVVARFLREVLKRNGIDNKGGRIISVINCVVEGDAQHGKKWENAVWDGRRMLYGQTRDRKGKLRSFASNLDIVAHELFHGVSGATARLEYEGETGALNESYSDIFGILISNWDKRRTKWDWNLGENVLRNCKAQRNFRDPGLFGQPKHTRDYRRDIGEHSDKGGVHTNSGIHNYAAYNIMVACDRDGDFLFELPELAAMFYAALTQHLSRQAKFSDSRRAVLLATRSCFRHLPAKYLDQRIKAVEEGFAAAGIE